MNAHLRLLSRNTLRDQLRESVRLARKDDHEQSPHWPHYADFSDAIACLALPRAAKGQDFDRARFLGQTTDMLGDGARAFGEFAKEALRVANAGTVDVDTLVDALIEKLTAPMLAERSAILGEPDAEFGGAWVDVGAGASAGRRP